MVVPVTIRGLQQAVKRLVVLGSEIARPLSKLTVEAAKDIIAPLREFDRFNYLELSRRVWSGISVPTLLWNRRRTASGAPYSSMSGIKADTRKLGGSVSRGSIVLMDTQRLWRSLWQRNHQDFNLKIGNTTLSFGTSTPYARKHVDGKSTTFKFGATQIGRHNRRVKRPKRGHRKRIRRGLDPTAKDLEDLEHRPFYVLRRWARDRYPVTVRLPKRSWVVVYPRERLERTRDRMEAFLRKLTP